MNFLRHILVLLPLLFIIGESNCASLIFASEVKTENLENEKPEILNSQKWIASEKILAKNFKKEYNFLGSPLISPDGRHVAFVDVLPENQDEFGDYFVVLDGKRGKVINSMSPAWDNMLFSPDSKRLIYFVGCEFISYEDIVNLGTSRPIHQACKDDPNYSSGVFGKIEFSPNAKTLVVSGLALEKKIPGLEIKNIPEEQFSFSSDSRRFAHLLQMNRPSEEGDSYQTIVVDGVEGKQYPLHSAYIEGPFFSGNSKHFAYAVRGSDDTSKKKKCTVLIDHQSISERDEGCRDFVLSPDGTRFAYIVDSRVQTEAFGNRDPYVVIDGKKGKMFAAPYVQYLSFSPDSKRVAYLVRTKQDDGEWFVVDGENEGKHFTLIHWPFLFSPDSSKLTYTASHNKWCGIVVNGTRWRDHCATQFLFSADSSRLAYIAEADDKVHYKKDGRFYVALDQKYFVGIDDRVEKKYDSITGLKFSPDNKTLVYAAKRGGKWFIVVNGEERKAYDRILVGDNLDYYKVKTEIIFDSNTQFHYMAVKGRQIILVDERLNQANEATDK